MNHEEFRMKLDQFLTGELPQMEQGKIEAHLQTCATCCAELAVLQGWKKLLKMPGLRHTPRPEFRADVQKKYGSALPQRRKARTWVTAAAACATLALAMLLARGYQAAQGRRQIFTEIVDQHSAVLSKGSSLDVASTDDQAVESWFREELPFVLHVPELKNTPFSLAGGRLAFLNQTPGAQLVFTADGRRISAFVFPKNKSPWRVLDGREVAAHRAAFHLEICGKKQLRYLLVGDVDAGTIHQLADLLEAEE